MSTIIFKIIILMLFFKGSRMSTESCKKRDGRLCGNYGSVSWQHHQDSQGWICWHFGMSNRAWLCQHHTIYNYKLLVGLIMCMKAFLLFRQEIMTQDGDMETSLKLWRQYHSILATVLTKPYLGYIKVIIIS